jgi:hypothetical protein
MPLRLPAGKRLAVNIGVDFDAMCAFSGHMATLSPSILSRGEFGQRMAPTTSPCRRSARPRSGG